MKYFSMFSGIGGFERGIELGIQRVFAKNEELLQSTSAVGNQEGQSEQFCNRNPEGLLCIGYSEIDRYAIQIYQRHFKEHKNYGNAENIIWSGVPDFDLLVGGFPCQAFSIAGKRKGFDDTRGTLFFEIARCLREKQPRLFVLENVKGLLSHDQGRTFLTIISTLDELGYDCQWQVLNSKNHGVPQNRERVFIIGHLRGTSRPEVFPFTGSGKIYAKEETAKCLTATNYKGIGNDGTTCVRTNQPNTRPEGDKPDSANSIRRTSYTDDMRIRRLTPTECERLQGFPDGWTEGISDTQRYKCLGNAVTVNVVQAIMEKIGKGEQSE